MGNIFFRQLPSRIMCCTKVRVILLWGMKNLTPKNILLLKSSEVLVWRLVKGCSPSLEYTLLHNAFRQLAKCLKNIFTHYKTLGWQ